MAKCRIGVMLNLIQHLLIFRRLRIKSAMTRVTVFLNFNRRQAAETTLFFYKRLQYFKEPLQKFLCLKISAKVVVWYAKSQHRIKNFFIAGDEASIKRHMNNAG